MCDFDIDIADDDPAKEVCLLYGTLDGKSPLTAAMAAVDAMPAASNASRYQIRNSIGAPPPTRPT